MGLLGGGCPTWDERVQSPSALHYIWHMVECWGVGWVHRRWPIHPFNIDSCVWRVWLDRWGSWPISPYFNIIFVICCCSWLGVDEGRGSSANFNKKFICWLGEVAGLVDRNLKNIFFMIFKTITTFFEFV